MSCGEQTSEGVRAIEEHILLQEQDVGDLSLDGR
jgi:hypothetical protein